MNKRKIDTKDIVIVLCSLLALILLCGVILFSKKSKEKANEELTSVSDNSEPTIQKELNTILCNEANAEGWIELYNSADERCDISGAKIYLNGEEVYSFDDNIRINPAELLSIDIGKNPGQSEKNILTFFDKSGVRLFDWYVPKLSGNQSYGRVTDGGMETAIMSGSRDKSNAEANPEEVTGIEFSVPSGFYYSPFNLKIKAPESYKIYYTTDGSKPTISSKEYKNEFQITNRSGSSYTCAEKAMGYARGENYFPSTIDMGTWVRAIMVDGNNNTIEEKSELYFIGLMEDGKYANMPVISINTDEENLFDYFDGIYISGRTREDAVAKGENTDNAANYHKGWSKEAEIRFFESNFGMNYSGDASIQIISDISSSLRQKPFRVTVSLNGVKGTSLEKLADDNGKLELTLSNKDSSYRIRDIIANRLVSGNEAGTADIQPCTLFVNGEYWGCYIVRKPYDKDYIEEQYGIGNQELSFARNNVWNDEFEDFYKFGVNSDMSVDANYKEFLNRADVESLTDYICINMFFSNADFSLRAGTVWKTKEVGSEKFADGKWRWLLAKLDNTMSNKAFSASLSTASIDSFLMESFAKEPFIQSLMMNDDFRKSLKASMTKIINEDFTEDRVETAVIDVKEKLKRPVVATDTRFYGNISDISFNDECDRITKFLNTRSVYITKYIDEIAVQSGDIDVLNEARGLVVESEEENEETEQ